MTDTPTTEEIPAATLVVFRQPSDGAPEILMVVRSKAMSFAGGAAVFPGGRVDPADYTLASALEHSCSDNDEAAHRIAAIRETLEETGLALGIREPVDEKIARNARAFVLEAGAMAPVLERFGWTLDLDRLIPFARWLPRGMSHSRIFDTRFYLYDLGTGAVDIAVDQTENTKLFWVTAGDALRMADEGEISIIFPTRRNLERLAQFDRFTDAKAHAEAIPVQTITPKMGSIDGADALIIPEDAGYPVVSEPLDKAMRG